MHARPRRRLATISAVSLLLMTGAAIRVFAGIELDNDVIIDWENTPGFPGRVVGAPRQVTNVTAVGPDLQVTVTGNLDSISMTFLDLVVRRKTVDCLTIEDPDCVTRLHWIELQDSHPPQSVALPLHLYLSAFGEFEANDFVGNPIPGDAIITVEARVRGAGTSRPEVTITLSGAGHQVAINRLGDVDEFERGVTLDIPPRSTELVRALGQLDSALLPRRVLADLDAPAARGADIAVGFTHVFDLPREGGDIVHGGNLKLRVKREGGDFSKDFILLDGAVRDLQSGRPRIPLIFLRELRASPVKDLPDIYEFDLNLGWVPISVLTAGSPAPVPLGWRDVTGDLEDGRLNVIVVGKSVVDFSDLTVTFDDPPAH